jgi:hypothetical protein
MDNDVYAFRNAKRNSSTLGSVWRAKLDWADSLRKPICMPVSKPVVLPMLVNQAVRELTTKLPLGNFSD